ncbi:ATP-binding protein [uncultured Alistipes sp.]|jgi:hypothetical protein|uniref:ATP-dependent nuclease n=1 Tax=uncultured Alistipes sp. TaxID=538949 RepID=UPI0025D7F6EB|nr:ATP-binding protein [uncultured Alistipes sp.]
MAKIHTLKIQNFRGLKNFEQKFTDTNLVCLIGRGDSGKTTILEAISIVLAPTWNVNLYDTDFHNCNVDESIIIEVLAYDLPLRLQDENKFGMHLQFIDSHTLDIVDDVLTLDDATNYFKGLIIRFELNKDLEPSWNVINPTNEDMFPISASDRSSLNMFLVSDYIDRHLSWGKGYPLFALMKQHKAEGGAKDSIVLNAVRIAKQNIDNGNFTELERIFEEHIKQKVSKLGVALSNPKTSLDLKDMMIRDDRVSMHDGGIPLRLKGKGSKRLISLAIQLSLIEDGGIILIDEIEQGLEADRVQTLIRELKRHTNSQVFITTHSRDVVVELTATELYRTLPAKDKLFRFDEDHQATIRKNPEALFAKSILVCEGATEIGIVRAYDNYLQNTTGEGLSFNGVRYADGSGSNIVNYCTKFIQAGYAVCLFCDSDRKDVNEKKQSLAELGILVIDCEDGYCIEQQIFNDISWGNIVKLIEYAREMNESSVKNNIISCGGDIEADGWLNEETADIRNILGKSSVYKAEKNGKVDDKSWFKRTDHGEMLGTVVCEELDQLKNKKLGSQFSQLELWITLL